MSEEIGQDWVCKSKVPAKIEDTMLEKDDFRCLLERCI